MKDIKHTNVTTVDAAVAELKKGQAAVIAGGTDILGELKGMITPNTPGTLVNIKTIPNLSYIKEEGGALKIGALTKLVDLAESSVVQSKYTVLAEAARKVASPEIRNMGTIGGNICQGIRCWYYWSEYSAFNCLRKDPKGLCYALLGDNRYHSIFGAVNGCVAVNPGDIAPALVALGAKVVTSKKTIDAEKFFAANVAPKSEGTTVLDADEIVTEIQIPTPAAGTKSAFLKFALRNAIDFPVVNCAAVITSSGGTVSAASICLNAVHNLPRKVAGAADAIKGKAIDTTSAEAAGAAAVTGAITLPKNKYMIQIAKVLVKRAVLACK